MPELPEVETTRRGIEAAVVGRRVVKVILRQRQLRWPVVAALARKLSGQRINAVRRRAKYLLLDVDAGTVLVHLGMSGSLRVLDAAVPALLHDHVDFVLDSGACLRFNDPRRFGSVHWIGGDVEDHPLLKLLAPEPLSDAFDAEYLLRVTRKRRAPIKQVLMNSRLVVGVGNIYASEALFRAGVRPTRPAGRVTQAEIVRLTTAIKTVLQAAIAAGGTTLRDYVNTDGMPGYFRQKLYVYERGGDPCRNCAARIKHIVQGQRSSYYCPQCQR